MLRHSHKRGGHKRLDSASDIDPVVADIFYTVLPWIFDMHPAGVMDAVAPGSHSPKSKEDLQESVSHALISQPAVKLNVSDLNIKKILDFAVPHIGYDISVLIHRAAAFRVEDVCKDVARRNAVVYASAVLCGYRQAYV